ncbi:MAG: ribonuclease J [Parvibaculaceae bacterium]|nr:ribonuclease J [Parvibaculaceae bacterium]
MKKSKPSTEDELVFLPLGGSGEIGMNLNLYGFGPARARKWIMVDLGVTFGDERTPGIDLIMPDPLFIEEHVEDLLAIVLTHAHEDHIGAVAHLWPRLRCPIYATPFTALLVRGKLVEAGIENQVELNIIPLGARFTLGPFDIEYVSLTHSIPEPNALAIRTSLGTVLHTGDWKIDPDPVVGVGMDEARLSAIGDEGVRVIVCDSTNVFSPGQSGSEGDVAESLTGLLGSCKGRVAVTTFASNVARVASIARAAHHHDRHPVLVGRAMIRIVAAAKEVGYLKDLPPFVSEDDAGHLPPDKVLFICTGSQGEPRAALARMADDTHPSVVLEQGDTVIFSSRVIPGNETSIFDMQNRLAERGIRIITEKDHFIHVSGHPCRDELTRMYEWVRPQIAVPVHGEARHLAEHAALARELKVPVAIVTRNGLMTRLAPGDPVVLGEVPSGRLYLDGEVLIEDEEGAVQERRRLSFAGSVFVALVLDAAGKVRATPQVSICGLPIENSRGRSFSDVARDAASASLERLSAKQRQDDDGVAELVRRAVRGEIRKSWGKKAQVSVVVSRI